MQTRRLTRVIDLRRSVQASFPSHLYNKRAFSLISTSITSSTSLKTGCQGYLERVPRFSVQNVQLRSFQNSCIVRTDKTNEKTEIGVPAGEHLQNKSLFQRILDFIGVTNTTFTYTIAKTLLDNCILASQNKVWYSDKRGRIGKDFRSRHTVLLLHIWMVHKRLLIEGDKGLLVQECLFDEFWEDTGGRIRALGVGELSVNKRLSEVQGYSFKFCMELDDAITRATEEERVDEIAGSLWRMLYLKREDIEPEHVLELAHYLRSEQMSLFNISSQAIMEGRFVWSKPALWKKAFKDSGVDEEIEDDLEEWQEAVAQDGKPYYWNMKTNETRWEKPASVTKIIAGKR